jgi:hypothetical protein
MSAVLAILASFGIRADYQVNVIILALRPESVFNISPDHHFAARLMPLETVLKNTSHKTTSRHSGHVT